MLKLNVQLTSQQCIRESIPISWKFRCLQFNLKCWNCCFLFFNFDVIAFEKLFEMFYYCVYLTIYFIETCLWLFLSSHLLCLFFYTFSLLWMKRKPFSKLLIYVIVYIWCLSGSHLMCELFLCQYLTPVIIL